MTKSKWWLLVIYCLLAVIVIATIVSCFVKVSYKPEIDGPDAYYISIENQATYDLADKVNEPERYNKIDKAFTESFRETFLTSLFSGRLSTKSRIESYVQTPSFSGYKLKLIYATQKTIKQHGKNFNPPTNTAETVEYNEILIDVKSGLGYTTQYVYYPYTYTDSNNVQKTGYFRQSVIANFDALYELLAA